MRIPVVPAERLLSQKEPTGSCAGVRTCFRSLLGLLIGFLISHNNGFAQAGGGTVTFSGAYTIHTFTSSGYFTVNTATAADIIVVAGGGGGGHQHAGGGGAGGVVGYYLPSVATGTYYVTVGAGGAGCSWYPYTGGNGGTSNALGVNTDGGGGGTGMPQYGNNGGSGGGDGYPSGGVQGGYETPGMGNSGSRGGSTSTFNGGGGGGAGSAGWGLAGGAPVTTWAGTFGGGGGGGYGGGAGGGAGAGNGGNGSAYGENAASNTGSGGGGGGNMDAFGGNGGSGIVVIRYLTQLAPADAAHLVSQNIPASVYPGQVFTFTQTWVNDGTATWSAANNYNVGAQNPYDNTTWGSGRYGTTGTVAPGATATITCTATAPALPGYYNLQTGLVHEGVTWFGGSSPNVVINVVNRDPTNTTSILSSAKAVLATNPTASVDLGYGASFYIRVSGTDPDGRLNRLYSRMDHIGGMSAWAYPELAVSGASASYDFGPYNTADAGGFGLVNVWTHVRDNDETGYAWQGNGWWSSDQPDINVVKATPSIAFSDQSFSTTTTMGAGNFNATASNPYGTGVTAPTGGITYSVVSTTGAGASPSGGSVGPGTVFYPGSYTVRASYAGDGLYNATDVDRTFTVADQAPTGSFTIDGTAAGKTIAFGQSISLASTISDPDGHLSAHSFWWDQGAGLFWTNPWIVWSYPADATGWLNLVNPGYDATGSTSTRSADFRAWRIGTFVFHAAGSDSITWLPFGQYTLTVTKSTPVTAFAGGSKNSQDGNTYTVQVSDLNAIFVNSYSSSVTAPTGPIAYTIVGPNTPITVGTVLSGSTTYTIRASYPGDGNYNAATKDVTFTIVLDPNGDVDNDVMSNQWEQDNFGSYTAAVASGDPDNDGLTNVAEYNLGKAPHVYDAGTSNLGGTIPLGWPNGGVNPGVAVGATKGELNVDKSGALTYTVPIWTSPGTAGMQPQVSLNYSSQAGNGIAGFGWSVSGVSAITRGGQTKAIDGQNLGATLSANDRFYLDGQRLIVTNGGSYGGEGTEYRTEIDSLTRVISHNSGTGPSYFTAWTKAGLKIEFGNTADSARASSPASGRSEKISWNVNRITDTSGNFIEFVYAQDAAAGTHLLSRINYTGSPTTPAYASLRFVYENRPDTATGYVFGSIVASLQRLKTITAYSDENIVRTYTLNYTERASASARSLLTSLTETGNDGTSYPALTFEYETPTGGWAPANYYSSPNYPWLFPPLTIAQKDVVTGTGLMDLNGDGYPDFVRKKNQNSGDIYNDAYQNTALGWVSNTSMRLPGSGATLAWENKQDCGGRLLDVNGDGFVDALYADANIAYATHNTGTSWDYNVISPTPAGFMFALNTTNVDSGRRLVDINGDGLVDIVWRTSTSDKGCLINNSNGQYQPGGAAWVSASQWAPPFDIMQNVSSGSQFFDVNGDGLPDLVQFGYTSSSIEAGIALNSPTGWGAQNVTWNRVTKALASSYTSVKSSLGTLGKYLPPALLAKDSTGWQVSPIGSEIVDLNGDGHPDILFKNPKIASGFNSSLKTAGAWLNTGDGWLDAPQYTPPVALMGRTDGSDIDSVGTVVVDLNGDGLPDLATYRAGQTSVYYLNTGHGWGSYNTPYQSGLDFSLPVPVTNSDVTVPTGFQFLDLNADGITDLIANGDFRYNLAKPTADRLTKVTNAMGVSAQPAYAVLTERDANSNPTVYAKGSNATYPTVDVTGPMLVVKSVTNDDGVGGQYPVTYTYAGLRTSFLYGSLGFSSMKVVDGRTLIASETTYAQEYPFVGMPIHQTTATSGGVVLSDTLITYGQKLLAGGTRFVFAADSFTTSKDLNGTVTGTVDTSIPNPASDIDDYGNIKKLAVTTDGYTKTTDSVFTNDTTNWFLGRSTSATVTSTGPSLPTIVRNSSFSYSATTGLLLTETVEPGSPTLALTTTYGYDSFGNKTSVTVSGANVTSDASGNLSAGATVSRATTTQYDFHGRFPIWTRNALSHQEDYYTYDAGHGGLTHMGGANGLPTLWTYDGFGRKIAEYRADGTASYTTYRWVAGAPSQAQYYGTGPAAKYSVETASTGATPSLAFYDAFGRAFLALGVNGDGKIVYQTTQYDAQSRAFAASTPYFATDTASWARTSGYDLLDRPIQTVTPDDEAAGGQVIAGYAYAGLQATATDPKGRVSRTVKNSQGWTTQNIRNENGSDGAPASTVTYEYDAIGNLTKTTADGTITTLAYDLRGRKTSMVDADMGTWQYRYNIFGELIWQKDAKGQITTMAYDVLGRLVNRTEPEGTTTWTYDTATKAGGQQWKGKLASVTAPGSYSESYAYDAVGRPASLTRTIDGVAYTASTTYDGFGRPLKTTYPATGIGSGPVATRNLYNGFGYLKEIRNWLDSDTGNGTPSGLLYWQADNYSVRGGVDGETYGNGLSNDRFYSAVTGRLRRATIDSGRITSAPFSVQDLAYTYDAMGNVKSRIDSAPSVLRSEYFSDVNGDNGYDGLDRLLTHRVVGGATVTVSYATNGNIAFKSDVGNYAYSGSAAGPHALTSAGTKSYTYDANGNMLTQTGRSYVWSSFNQVKTIADSTVNKTADFSFGAGHERTKQVRKTGSTITDTTIYVGALFEKVTTTAGTLVEYKHYIMAPTGRIGVVTQSTANGVIQANTTRYFHTDGLGSITVVSDEQGRVLKRYAYDAWGKQSTLYTNNGSGIVNQAPTTRGFTDHEMLSDFGLVHMNGRVYDPVLGRFLSADPFIGDPGDSQEYNRYSYVGNNPMNATDPSGYFSLKDVVKIVAVVVAAWVTAGAALYAYAGMTGATFVGGFAGALSSVGLAAGWSGGWAIAAGVGAGFGSSFASSLLNGGSIGDAFKAGAIGGIVGGISAGIAGKIGDFAEGHEWFQGAGQNLAHGATQGALTEVQGGEFRHGFYAGFASSAASGPLHAAMPDSVTGRTVGAAIIGGTASALGGGKFANGAVSAAFTHLFNDEAHAMMRSMGGSEAGAYYPAGSFGPSDYVDRINAAALDAYVNVVLVPAAAEAAGAATIWGLFRASAVGRVFWNGGDVAKNAAIAHATARGGSTLEMTLGGRIMDWASKVVPRSWMKPLWTRASANWARGAEGPVDFVRSVRSKPMRADSQWLTTERPILIEQGNPINPVLKP